MAASPTTTTTTTKTTTKTTTTTKATVLPDPFLPFDDPRASDLEIVGGKGANLAKLTTGGFDVPDGFLIPTSAYRSFVRTHGLDKIIDDILRGADEKEDDDDKEKPESSPSPSPSSDPRILEDASTKIRSAFSSRPIDGDLLTASLSSALRYLDNRPVAVRSSATAEDLPDLSFAGQQDTYLNVSGHDTSAVSRAIIDCWSSLWTARAIGYRNRNGIPHHDVALCVVVQIMVEAESSGVMFTANPLTGKRSEVVVDATLGLGEALVGGLVEPDHYVIDAPEERRRLAATTRRGKDDDGCDDVDDDDCCDAKETNNAIIVRKTLGSKAVQIRGKEEGGGVSTIDNKGAECAQVQAMTDEAILELARIGKDIEKYYDFPQDVEFAVTDNGRKIHILQSRPITSLYPLPSNISTTDPLRVMFGFHLVQGVFEPFHPLGHTTIREVLLGGATIFGIRTTLAKQTVALESGMRVWINIGGILRHPRGRTIYLTAARNLDPTVPQILEDVLKDPRMDEKSTLPRRAAFNWALFLLGRIPRILRCLIRPEHMAKKTQALFDGHVARMAGTIKPTGNLSVDFAHAVNLLCSMRTKFPFFVPIALPAIVPAMACFFGILKRLSEEVAEKTGDARYKMLYLEIAKGLPNNVTTEMDLALWHTSQTIKNDVDSFSVFEKLPSSELAARYLDGSSLPRVAQNAVSDFLSKYGSRGLGEIDLGRTRWSGDPEHILSVLKSYMDITDPDKSPEAVFARGAEEAHRAAQELEGAVRKHLPFGFVKAMQVRWAVRRYRALGGLRESPKFFMIRSMGLIRSGLLNSAEQMKQEGWLDQRDDVLYLEMSELESLAKDVEGRKADDPPPASLPALRASIQERREQRIRELRRKQIPRIMLSDGTAYYDGLRHDGEEHAEGSIVGDPVSPGVIEGVVRVVFDPLETQLKPGEILVCPGTDPAWTPLFLAAHGLVMECGGMMTHGSVVAREYGIPAVVGVHEATKRLETGRRIRLDGSSGLIEILE